MGKKLKMGILGASSLLVVGIAAMGFAHTKWGRPLLTAAGECPMGMDGKKAPIEQVEKASFAAIKQFAGDKPAPSRPALGFSLDEWTQDQARAWTVEKHLTCVDTERGTAMKCTKVPTSALPETMGGEGEIDELVFGFRTGDHKLMSVDTWRSNVDPTAAIRQVQTISASLKKTLGEPAVEGGKLDAETITNYTYMMNYKFSDTVIMFSSSRIPSGIAIRERFISAKNPV